MTARTRRSLQGMEISIERDLPLCGESLGDSSFTYRCIVEMSGGEVDNARIIQRDDETVRVSPPVDVELTRGERESAEVDWSEKCRDHEDACREDAAESRRDMERGL